MIGGFVSNVARSCRIVPLRPEVCPCLDLNAVRGIVVGVCLGAVMWSALIASTWIAIRVAARVAAPVRIARQIASSGRG